MKGEIWKEYKGYKKRLLISNKGNVMSEFDGTFKITHSVDKSKRHLSYPCIGVDKNGKCSAEPIHRIVAKLFVPNPNNYPVVNHKDRKTWNFVSDNLEWVTRAQNVAHGKGIKNYMNY